MSSLLRGIILWSFAFVAGGAAGADEAEAPGPQADRATIEALHATLLEVMQAGTYAEREALVAPAIDSVFDIPTIARISVGRTWKALEEAQRAAYVTKLHDLVVATYASRFDNYDDQRFETESAKAVRSGVVVSTNLVKSDGSKVSLDYALRDGKVFNVVADGVSDLSLRRADYNSIIKTHGFERLLEHIDEKTAVARAGD